MLELGVFAAVLVLACAVVGFSAYRLGWVRGANTYRTGVQQLLQAGLLQWSYMPGLGQALDVKFQEPTITGDATLEVDHGYDGGQYL